MLQEIFGEIKERKTKNQQKPVSSLLTVRVDHLPHLY